ncbi:putative protein of unknown function (DUF4243) [Lyophyllum shimeji]|uniref:Uncharacterized protein n=1 Tax=Lyophyllum shimeji TaxID=47721 RepID=A0A9P3PY80_LYOSH|nr:putative protein of unknown function (DUF4243) [Lyophyllum shimeji]
MRIIFNLSSNGHCTAGQPTASDGGQVCPARPVEANTVLYRCSHSLIYDSAPKQMAGVRREIEEALKYSQRQFASHPLLLSTSQAPSGARGSPRRCPLATQRRYNNGEQDLFPIPSSLPSPLAPKPWPGVNPESTAALRDVLRDNHEKWHIFVNDIGYHNHSTHRAIANWALGADGDLIRAGYEVDSASSRPAGESPEPITLRNWKEHLGDDRYYAGYLAFFTNAIREQGTTAVLEKYIFSKDANVDSAASTQPQVLNRFIGGLTHSTIHIGYGLEFSIPGMVVEGLTEAAVTSDGSSAHIPDDFFDWNGAAGPVENTLSSRFKSLFVSQPQSKNSSTESHVFTVLARVLNDPALGTVENPGGPGVGLYGPTMKQHGAALIKHMSNWRVDGSDPADVEQKIEQLSWANCILFGVGGWAKDEPFNADFFLMHLVTSSIFIRSYPAYITPSSLENMLRGYLLTSLGWWVSRGRPTPDIKAFYEATSVHPTPSGPLPSPGKGALHPADFAKVTTPNPWLPIIETSVVHPDDHVPKIQRALSHYSSVYGSREAGQPDFAETELPGAEVLDGTLFIRVAGLTAKRMGRVREGKDAAKDWDNKGFYKTK